MKKLILGLFFLVTSAQVMAGPGHHYHRPHHNHWVAPLIIGGVVGAVIMNQYQPPPPQVYNMPPPPYGYRYIQVYDGYCNCYKWALTPNY